MDFIIFENELKCLMLAFLHFDTDYYPNQTESLFCCIPFRKAKENCLYKVGFIQKKKKRQILYLFSYLLCEVCCFIWIYCYFTFFLFCPGQGNYNPRLLHGLGASGRLLTPRLSGTRSHSTAYYDSSISTNN